MPDGYENVRALDFDQGLFGLKLTRRMAAEKVSMRGLSMLLAIDRHALTRIANGKSAPTATQLMRLAEWFERTNTPERRRPRWYS